MPCLSRTYTLKGFFKSGSPKAGDETNFFFIVSKAVWHSSLQLPAFCQAKDPAILGRGQSPSPNYTKISQKPLISGILCKHIEYVKDCKIANLNGITNR